MAEFVEHGLDFVDCEQRGRVAGRMGEVADVEDDGALYGHEYCHMIVVGVAHIIYSNFGVVLGSVGHFGECDTIQSVGHGEYAFAHTVDMEILAHLVFVKSVFGFTHLFGVVIVVPGFDGDLVSLFVGESLHLGYFLGHTGGSRFPDLHEEVFGIFHVLGHDILCHVIGIVLISEQVGLACACLYDFGDYGIVVVLS